MSSTSNAKDEPALEGVVFEQIDPLIRRIVRWRLGSSAPAQDQEDVVADVLLELFIRLGNRSEADPIADVTAYAAVTAHHGCDLYLRRRFPQRHRLSTRLRYLFETSKDYALWECDSAWICGFAKDRGASPKAGLDPEWAKQIPLPSGATEVSTVAAIFTNIGGAIRFADLINAVSTLLDVRDHAKSIDTGLLPARTEDPNTRIDQRRALERLWNEIALLPLSQRVALLLNLRDDAGACALTSLPATGVASMRRIAEVIGMPAEELAALWPRLPLNDLEIAARLDLSRQQVINLRKSARQRLTRRLAGNIGLETASKDAKGERD